MASEVLKEFLVSLGWKVDGNGEQKFVNAVRGATLHAKLLGDAIEAMGKAAFSSLSKVSEQFEDLYYSSQRTGLTIQNIKALQFAAGQLGSSADAMLSSLEAVSRHLRESPGYESMLHSLGVTTENGKLTTKSVNELGAAFKAMSDRGQYYSALAYANVLGIDENTMRALMSGELTEGIDRYNRKVAALGFDQKKMAEDSKNFMNGIREISTSLGVILEGAISKFMERFGGDFQTFIKWLDEHGPALADAFANIGKGLMDIAEGAGKWLIGADKWISATTGWAHALEAVGLALLAVRMRLGSLLAVPMPPWLLAAMGLGAASLAATAEHPEMLNSGGAGTSPTPLPETEAEDGLLGLYKRGWNTVKGWFGGNKGARTSDAANRGRVPTAGPDGAPGTYRPIYRLGNRDLSDAVVNTIAGEARANDQRSVDAVIDNMLNRVGTSTYGPSGNLEEVARAQGQYAGYRVATEKEAEFIRGRIRAIASGAVPDITSGSNEYRAGWYHGPWGWKHGDAPVIGGNRFAYNPKGGVGPYAAYPEAHKSPEWGIIGSAIASPFFLNQIKPQQFQTSPLGVGPQSWNSSTTRISAPQNVAINIHGAEDPHRTAREIAGHQGRINSDLVRNLQGAVA